jgi:hypothetical protein
VNLAVSHLSDEAIAAFADRMLAVPAQHRAERHLALCPECATAVDEQRAAVSALRAAPAPAMPLDLLERLRAVPVTTPLTPSTMALAPDGSAVFPAFGTRTTLERPARDGREARPAPRSPGHQYHLPAPASALSHLPHFPQIGRRTQQLALVAVTAAMMTVGVAASASAGTASPAPVRPAPANSDSAPANSDSGPANGASTNRDEQLVSTVRSGSTRP